MSVTRQCPPAANRGAKDVVDGDDTSLAPKFGQRGVPTSLVEFLDHMQHRVLQEALTTATANYWERRAESFEWAKPEPPKTVLSPQALELRREQWRRCDERARACRNAAEFWRRYGLELCDDEVAEVLAEISGSGVAA